MERRVLAVATQMQARTEGLDGLQLPMQDMPDNIGRHFASGMAGSTEGSHINAVLVTADTDAALTAARRGTAAATA